MKRKVHYAWFITLGCFIVMFYGLGLGFNCISVFLNPLMESIGVSNTARSSITVFYQSGSVIALILVGAIIKRIGIRKTIFISGICMALGYVVLTVAKSIFLCYVAMLIIGIGYGAGGIVPCSLLIATWFSKKKGLALGLATCGSGVATIIFPSVIGSIIKGLGIQKAFLIHGGIIAVLVVIANIILRDNPDEVASMPYGEETVKESESYQPEDIKQNGHSKKCDFIIMAAAIIAVGLIISPVVTHMTPIIAQSGYSDSLAAKAVSAYGIAMLVGKPMYGAIVDRLGVTKSNIYIFTALLITMLIGMSLGSSNITAFAFTISFGIGGAPIITIGLPIWVSELFGKINIENSLAMLKLCSSLGGTLGATIPGIIIDNTGSYELLFKIYIILILGSFCAMQFLFISKNKISGVTKR